MEVKFIKFRMEDNEVQARHPIMAIMVNMVKLEAIIRKPAKGAV